MDRLATIRDKLASVGLCVTGSHPLRGAHLERMAGKLKEALTPPPHKAWQCKIGIMGDAVLPPGADAPMRRAVEDAFFAITGKHAEFNFSGWGAQLDKYELDVAQRA